MLMLVTRPQPQADEWAAALRAKGIAAAALPLIDIAEPPQAAHVAQTWQALAGTRMVMFVSPNAVAWFAKLRPTSSAWPAASWAAAPGPGTALALLEHLVPAGLQPAHIVSPPAASAQFDSEHLWPMLRAMSWQDQRVLIVSGGDDGGPRGRAWLTQQLLDAGAQVQAVQAYQRLSASWQATERLMAERAYEQPQQHTWLLSSSEAVDHLLALMGPLPGESRAMVTHPRIAEKCREAGFDHITVVKPDLSSLAAAMRQ